MSKFDKFKEILNIGSAVAKPFVPGAAGTALSAVTAALNAHPERPSDASADAIKKLAADNDEQTAAILALHERVKKLEAMHP
jgi:hypothetical protein